MTTQDFLDNFKQAKIIDNKQRYEGFSAQSGTFTDLLWPCFKYEVELQVQREDLDIFERTVLKLAQCQSPKSDDIAKSMCIQKETVEFIQQRLVSKKYLNDRIFSLTKEGEAALSDLEQGKNVEQTVVTVFKDLLCGKMLPYVEKSPALNSHNGFFCPKPKNTGDEPTNGLHKDFMTRYILPGNGEKTAHLVYPLTDWNFPTQPKVFEILRAIKAFNKISGRDDNIRINPTSTAVDIKGDGEPVFLKTLAFAREGSAEIICTDGGGFDVSDDFSDYIKNYGENFPWLKRMLEKGSSETKSHADNREVAEKISFAYKNISELVLEAVKNLRFIEAENDSLNNSERLEKLRNAEVFSYNLYTAFERTLQAYCKFYHNSESEDAQIQLADTEARRVNQEKIRESDFIDDSLLLFYPLAEKLEFSVLDETKSLLKVYPGKIKGMRNGQEAELVPLLCLALAEAIDNTNAPLRDVAKTNENFLFDLYQLKGLRDNTTMAHGPGLKQTAVSFTKLKKLYESIASAMKMLMPELQEDFAKFSDGGFEIKNEIMSASQRRYNTKLALYKEFGVSKITALTSALQNQLVNAVLTFDSQSSVVSTCCSVIQQFLDAAVSTLVKRTNPSEKSKWSSEFAKEKAVESGFSLSDGKFSPRLSLVNRNRIRKAVCGGGCDTLGAALVAFLILCPNDELAAFASNAPNTIEHIEKMLSIRGHADVRKYSAEEVSTLREKTYSIIKELIEFI